MAVVADRPTGFRRRTFYLDATAMRAFVARHILLESALVLWLVTLPRIDLDAMSGLGLLSVMPLSGYGALLALTISFFRSLHRGAGAGEMAVHLAVLIFILHATLPMLSGTVRYSWAWKHVGIVDYIQRFGVVDPEIGVMDVYHNWPSGFALAAFLTEIAGFETAASFAAWAPVVFNALFVGAVIAIIGSLTSNRRIVWAAAWLFLITNWVGQDYFSPQAFAFFLYLVTLAILLRWFSDQPPRRLLSWAERFRVRVMRGAQVLRLVERPGRVLATERAVIAPADLDMPLNFASGSRHYDPTGHELSYRLWGRKETVIVFSIVAVLVVALITSHPLTPLMLLAAAAGLVILRVGRARWFPVVLAMVIGIWMLTWASPFVADRFAETVEETGALASNFGNTFLDLSRVATSQVIVAWMGRGLVVAVLLLAVVGLFRWIRGGVLDLRPLVLAAAPVFMLAMGDYDGEALFRVYLFSVPFMVFLGAHAFFPERSVAPTRPTFHISLVVSLVLLGGFLFAYFGKDNQYTFTADEVRAAEVIYANAPEGTLLIEGSANYPGKFAFYERFTYVPIDREPTATHARILADPVGELVDWMSNPEYRASFLIITESQKVATEDLGSLPPGALATIEATLLESPSFITLFHSDTASVFTLDPKEMLCD